MVQELVFLLVDAAWEAYKTGQSPHLTACMPLILDKRRRADELLPLVSDANWAHREWVDADHTAQTSQAYAAALSHQLETVRAGDDENPVWELAGAQAFAAQVAGWDASRAAQAHATWKAADAALDEAAGPDGVVTSTDVILARALAEELDLNNINEQRRNVEMLKSALFRAETSAAHRQVAATVGSSRLILDGDAQAPPHPTAVPSPTIAAVPIPATSRWGPLAESIDPRLVAEAAWPALAAALDRAQQAGYPVEENLPRLAAQAPLPDGHAARDLHHRLVEESDAAITPIPPSVQVSDAAATTDAARRRLGEHPRRGADPSAAQPRRPQPTTVPPATPRGSGGTAGTPATARTRPAR